MGIMNNELWWAIGIAVVLGGTVAFLLLRDKKGPAAQISQAPEREIPSFKNLQLQAYERLILLAERISLPYLVGKLNQPGISLREMQSILTQQIRQEFEYNVTQQIYVTPEAWEAIKNLKDQNLLIINQVAAFLPPEATGADLNKTILEMLMENPKASLHDVVSQALSFEAKKLMH